MLFSFVLSFSVSTFLPPLTPRALPRFFATMEALSPPGHSSSGLQLLTMNAVPFPVRDPCFISLQLQTILSPTTLCIPIVLLTALARDRSRNCRSPFTGRFPVLASPQISRLANASWPNRVQHCFVYGLVFRFRLLSTPPLDDAVTFRYGQASVPVRKGLSPFCWCVLSGALILTLRVV